MAATIGEMSFSDRKRFALCYLSITNKSDVDWAAAAAAYDPNVKEASFKTVTSKATKKYTNDLSELPEADINRFALCFVYCNQHAAVDWSVASQAYSSKVKEASFKTVTMKALKKLDKTAADDSTATSSPGKEVATKKSPAKKAVATTAATKKPVAKKTPAGKTTTTKKRKAGDTDNDNDDNDDEDAKPKKPRKNLKSLQPKVKSESDDEAGEIVDAIEDDIQIAAFNQRFQEYHRGRKREGL